MRSTSRIHHPAAKQTGHAETPPLIIGEPFNPYRESCGFYPPEIVWKLSELRDGDKRTYERLVRYAGQDGLCWPRQTSLRDELLVTVRQVQRRLSKLESAGLIRRRVIGRGRGKGVLTHFQFLAHRAFPGAKPRDEAARYNATSTSCCATLQGDINDRYKATCMSPPYKDESSTRESRNRSIDGEAISADCQTTNLPEPSETFAQWNASQAEVEEFRVYLQKHIGADKPPDLVITGKILALFNSREDCQAWGNSLTVRHRGRLIRTYGFYLNDVEKYWPADRDKYVGAIPAGNGVSGSCEGAVEERSPQTQESLPTPEATTAPANPPPVNTAARAHVRPCRACHNGGLVYHRQQDAPAFYTWCDCHHAAMKIQEKGEEWAAQCTAEQKVWWETAKAKVKARQSQAPLPPPPAKSITAEDFAPFDQRKPQPRPSVPNWPTTRLSQFPQSTSRKPAAAVPTAKSGGLAAVLAKILSGAPAMVAGRR